MAARRSTRRRFDDESWDTPAPTRSANSAGTDTDDDPSTDEPSWSTYRDAGHGPTPTPAWVVTDPRAVDTDHGVMKTGKEADVSLLERRVPDGIAPDGARATLMAVKRYRSAEHRMFHRDAGYLEGRRVKESREMRAIETRTAYGRKLIASQWAVAEFDVLSRLWASGASVPYPVQLIGTELMMEFIGTPDGQAAPRLAQLRPDRSEAHDLYAQLVELMRRLAELGLAHGDLSAYNVLVQDGRVVLIDLPQAVDIVGNPQGFEFLRRDCDNICQWFAHHGLPAAEGADLFAELRRAAPGDD
jgi:RIO kinase 1